MGIVLCREVVSFSESPLLEVPLYTYGGLGYHEFVFGCCVGHSNILVQQTPHVKSEDISEYIGKKVIKD